jgi:hypothetical protein
VRCRLDFFKWENLNFIRETLHICPHTAAFSPFTGP